MVPVQIVGIRRGSPIGASAVLLGDSEKLTRILPIMVSEAEAHALAVATSPAGGVFEAEADTHHLAATLMQLAGTRLDEVVVTELVDGEFFAELFVETADGMKSASARASDGVDLAVRMDAPVFVRERVLDSVGVHLDRDVSGSLSEAEINDVLTAFEAIVEPDSSPDAVGEQWRPDEGKPQDDVGFMDDD